MCALTDDPPKSSVVLDRELDWEQSLDGPRIRCPLCGWSPCKDDRWSCSCGQEWNTFDTGGVCPACLHQWTETQCLSCARWSPHSDFGTLIWPHFGRLMWPHLIYSDRSSYPVPASRDGEGDGQETQGGTV